MAKTNAKTSAKPRAKAPAKKAPDIESAARTALAKLRELSLDAQPFWTEIRVAFSPWQVTSWAVP